jgi:competence protein ComEA
MKEWRLILYGVLIGLLSAGAILLISKPQRGAPIILSPPPTPSLTVQPGPTPTALPIVVQIGGKVLIPGVYTMEPDTRLGDLIEAAGGLTSLADESRVNLAILMSDGDYFFIPGTDEEIPETARNAVEQSNLSSSSNFAYPLNINTATIEAFESLPGIGPTKAEDIVAYRDRFGSFSSIDDLLNVDGIGPATLDSIRDYLVVEP